MSAHTQNWTAFHTTETHRHDWAPGYDRPEALKRKPLLDKPSEPHPILSAKMDYELLRIMLVSDGAVMALRERTTGSRGASTPTSALAVTIDDLGGRFTSCKTHRQRLMVIKEAMHTADRLRYAPDRSVIQGTREWREAIANDNRSVRVLAVIYSVSKSTIARIKKDVRAEPTPTLVQLGKRHSVKERELINQKRTQDAKAAHAAAVEAITVVG